MSKAFARGACPGLSSPMETGDGLLARFVPAAPIAIDSFIAVCAAARAHGNGTIEISARGSLQVRGLTRASAPRFAETIAALGIEICESVPVIADPLPSDPSAVVDTAFIAAQLRRETAARGLCLAPKVSVVIDGGGSISLDPLFADIRLRAAATLEGPRFRIGIAGDAGSATPAGSVAPEGAVDAALQLLARIAALGPEARGADLLPDFPAQGSAPRGGLKRADAVGLHQLKDTAVALGIGLAFGHAEEEAIKALVGIAGEMGAGWARPAPGRALLLGPFAATAAKGVKQRAELLGFVVEASDPRRRIAACPGAPLCLHGLLAARALAAELAKYLPLPADDGIALHVSGCAKGCAHPAPAPLTVVGTEQGCGIVRNGTARCAPSESVRESELVPALTAKREAVHA
jgi:precorrin-3B synthase